MNNFGHWSKITIKLSHNLYRSNIFGIQSLKIENFDFWRFNLWMPSLRKSWSCSCRWKLLVLLRWHWQQHGISRRILDSRIEIVVCGVPGNSIMMRCIKVDMNTFGAPGCKIWLKEEFINFKCINESFILDNFK